MTTKLTILSCEVLELIILDQHTPTNPITGRVITGRYLLIIIIRLLIIETNCILNQGIRIKLNCCIFYIQSLLQNHFLILIQHIFGGTILNILHTPPT